MSCLLKTDKNYKIMERNGLVSFQIHMIDKLLNTPQFFNWNGKEEYSMNEDMSLTNYNGDTIKVESLLDSSYWNDLQTAKLDNGPNRIFANNGTMRKFPISDSGYKEALRVVQANNKLYPSFKAEITKKVGEPGDKREYYIITPYIDSSLKSNFLGGTLVGNRGLNTEIHAAYFRMAADTMNNPSSYDPSASIKQDSVLNSLESMAKADSPATASDLLELVNLNNMIDNKYKNLFNILLNKASLLSTKVELVDGYKGVDSDTYMVYDNVNDTIQIDPSVVTRNPNQFAESIMHEIIHPYSINALNNPITQAEKDFRRKVTILYNNLVARINKGEITDIDPSHPAIKDIEEFITYGLSNEFINNHLTNIPVKSFISGQKSISPNSHVSYVQKLWNFIKELITSTFNYKSNKPNQYDSNTALELSKAFDELLQSATTTTLNNKERSKTINNTINERPKYQIKATKENVGALLNKIDKIDTTGFDKLGKSLARAVDQLNIQLRRYRETGTDGYIQGTFNQVKSLTDYIEKKDFVQGALDYTKYAEQTLSAVLNQTRDQYKDLLTVKNVQKSAEFLRKLKSFANTYNLLPEIYAEMLKSISDPNVKANLEKAYGNAAVYKAEIEPLIKELQLNIVNKFLSTYDTSIANGYTIDLDNQLVQAPKDINGMERLLDAASDVSDDVIKIADRAIKTKILEGREKALGFAGALDRIIDKAKTDLNIKDDQKLFDLILEKDEKGEYTGEIIGKQSVEYKKQQTDIREQMKASGYSEAMIQQALLEHYKKSGKTDQKANNAYQNMLNNPKLKEFYDNITKMYSDLQDLNPKGYSMGRRLPAIVDQNKLKLLKAKSTGDALERLKINLERDFLKEDLREFQLEDEAGNEVNFLPVFYTGRNVPKELIDVNLRNTLKRFASSTYRYSEMSEIIDALELTKDQVKERTYTKTTSAGSVLNPASLLVNKTITISGEQSSTYNRFNTMMNMVAYGRAKVDEGTVELFGWNVDKAKLIDNVNKYTAINALSLNLYSAISNVMTGSTMTRIESIAGEYYNIKSLAKADAILLREIPKLLGDLGNTEKKSKLYHWLREFDVMQKYGNELGNPEDFFHSILNALQHQGDMMINMRTSLALAFETKITDEKTGEELNLWEALEVRDGRLRYKKDGFNDPGFAQKKIDFILKQNFVNKRLHGIYNDIDKNALQQYALGRAVMLFRRFVIPGFNRRFETIRYNQEGQVITEGNYRTLFRYLISDLKTLKFNTIKEWKNLPTRDKANIIRSLTEVVYAIGLSILGGFLANLAHDDEENYALNMAAYNVNRLYSELLFYSNPGEFLKILKSPSAAVNTIDKLMTTLSPMAWFDEIETGKNTGKVRGRVALEKLVPIYNIYEKLKDPSNQLQFILQ